MLTSSSGSDPMAETKSNVEVADVPAELREYDEYLRRDDAEEQAMEEHTPRAPLYTHQFTVEELEEMLQLRRAEAAEEKAQAANSPAHSKPTVTFRHLKSTDQSAGRGA